jgi:hypothetical protein
MNWVLEGIQLRKWIKRKVFSKRTPHSFFLRFKLSLMSCSPAELISVSFEHLKFQFNQLYLQPVEKDNHLPKLKIPHPVQFAPQAHLNREIEKLRNENSTGTYVVLGLSLLLVGVSLYVLMEKEREKDLYLKVKGNKLSPLLNAIKSAMSIAGSNYSCKRKGFRFEKLYLA